jgi:GWxTD domain-containing protein
MIMTRTFLRKLAVILVLLTLLPALHPQSREKKPSAQNLELRYRQWLEEEVVYIITEKERDVFLRLQTDRERDIFIEAFWKQRDPTPNTPANEFRSEHERRIQYANQNFGRESPQPGWRSEMGRVYITLGEPKQVERYEFEGDLYPLQVWFYEGMVEYGLPSAFYVVFFKKYNAGDYILYSPIRDGPQSLLIHYAGDQTSYIDAARALAEINPNLAQISLNLIPGEMSMLGTTPTMASDILISAKVPSAPTYKVKDSYAEKLLAYKDKIDVEYTANYIESDFLARVYFSPDGIAYVHYLLEPSRLAFEEYGGRFTANLEIDGNIVDERGRFVYQFDRRVPIEMNARQIVSISDKLFSYQDVFPVVPGRYKLSVILKNTVSKEFTTFEAPVTVPDPREAWMSVPLLANLADRSARTGHQIKPFLLGDVLLRPSPRNDFLRSDGLTVCLQFRGLSPELREGGTVELAILGDDGTRHVVTRALDGLSPSGEMLETLSLSELPPAYYMLEATLRDPSQNPVRSEKSPFYITPVDSLNRPWVLSMPITTPDSPEIANILGTQLFNKKAVDEAIPQLESALRRAPAEGKFALDLARAYLEKKEYERVKATVKPFLDGSQESGFLLCMGQACQALGEAADALSFYKTYLLRFGTNIAVLNSLGDCHLALGQKGEALTAFAKSLEIEPNQEKIRALVRDLEGKK